MLYTFVEITGPSGSTSTAAESRASSSRSPGKTVIVRAVSHSTYLGDFFLSKLYPNLSIGLYFLGDYGKETLMLC